MNVFASSLTVAETMSEPSDQLRDALIAAYPTHVEQRVRSIGVDPERVRGGIDQGREWLESQLTDLLAQPFEAQRRGPLEVFQESMRFPTQALAELGAEPVVRDEATSRILPGDAYDLAPASSSVLGEDVWAAHLSWGAAKARAMTGGRD